MDFPLLRRHGLRARVEPRRRAARRGLATALGALPMVVLISAPALAQDEANARFHVGVLSFTPTITVTNFGLDSNVFNESTDPKSDITATVTPAIDTSMRLGPTRLSWSGRSDATFFKQYSDQSTLGTVNAIRLDIPLNRLRLSLGDSYVNARERPTIDIDTRARRRENTMSVSADLALTSLTHVTMTGDLGSVSFDEGATSGGEDLGFVLDRESTRLGVSLARSITPLTTVVGSFALQQDTFSGDTSRNNTTRRAAVGMSFKPFALVSGRFDFGLLQFQSEDGKVPTTTGPAMSADLGYTLLGATHFGLRVDRAVTYSLDAGSSYSIQTGLSVSAAHNIRETVDITGSVTRQLLDYQGTIDAASPDPSTVMSVYDAALGYRMKSVHWGLHASYSVREPRGGAQVSRYENFRVFASASYGFQF